MASPRWKRYLSPPLMTTRLREKGILWCSRRSLKLMRLGLDLGTRPVRTKLWKLWGMLDNIRYRGKKQSDVLYAFYDLAVSPATFDIVCFLVFAEIERKRIGCSSMHAVIVPGPDDGFREGDVEAFHRTGGVDYDTDSMRWRLRNILVPCCWLIPSCQRVTVCASCEEALAFQASLVKHIFPKRYTVRFPEKNYALRYIIDATSRGFDVSTIQPTPQALRYVSDWLQLKTRGLKVVTISLRECPYEPARNSNLKAWGEFARSLDPSVYCPVIIRDTAVAFKPLPSELEGLLVFHEASWNTELRAALYELCYLDMSVTNGTAVLCLFNRRTRFLMFKLLTPLGVGTTEDYYRSEGFEPGSQYKHLTPFQRYVWEDDRLEVIQKAFRAMCDTIEGASKPVSGNIE